MSSENFLRTSNGRFVVLDGDTVVDTTTGTSHRLFGGDTTETGKGGDLDTRGSREAQQRLHQFLEAAGDDVDFEEVDEDKYGRKVSFLRSKGQDYMEGAVRAGTATQFMDDDRYSEAAYEGALAAERRGYDAERGAQATAELNASNYVESLDPGIKAGGFGGAIARGTQNMQASLYGFTEALGYLVGSDTVTKWAGKGIERNLKEAMLNPAAVQSWDDVDSLDKLWEFTYESIGEFIPQLGADAAALGLGTLAGHQGVSAVAARRAVAKSLLRQMGPRARKEMMEKIGKEGGVGRLAAAREIYGREVGKRAAIGTIYAQTTGETQLGLREEGVESPVTALGVGALKTSLEYLPLKGVLNALKRSTGASPGELARTAKEIAKQAGIEGSTEGVQTVLDFMAASYHTGKDPLSPDNLKELRTAFAKGALLGGTMGGTTGVMPAYRMARNKLAKHLEARSQNPDTDPGFEIDVEIDLDVRDFVDTFNSTPEGHETGGTAREPGLDVAAQVGGIFDGTKNSMYLSIEQSPEQHKALEIAAIEAGKVPVSTEEGTMVLDSAQEAAEYKGMTAKERDNYRSKKLGYTETKDVLESAALQGEELVVVQARNTEGAVVQDEVVTAKRVPEAAEKLQQKYPDAVVGTMSPDEGLLRREVLIQEEDAGLEAFNRGVNEIVERGRTEGPANVRMATEEDMVAAENSIAAAAEIEKARAHLPKDPRKGVKVLARGLDSEGTDTENPDIRRLHVRGKELSEQHYGPELAEQRGAEPFREEIQGGDGADVRERKIRVAGRIRQGGKNAVIRLLLGKDQSSEFFRRELHAHADERKLARNDPLALDSYVTGLLSWYDRVVDADGKDAPNEAVYEEGKLHETKLVEHEPQDSVDEDERILSQYWRNVRGDGKPFQMVETAKQRRASFALGMLRTVFPHYDFVLQKVLVEGNTAYLYEIHPRQRTYENSEDAHAAASGFMGLNSDDDYVPQKRPDGSWIVVRQEPPTPVARSNAKARRMAAVMLPKLMENAEAAQNAKNKDQEHKLIPMKKMGGAHINEDTGEYRALTKGVSAFGISEIGRELLKGESLPNMDQQYAAQFFEGMHALRELGIAPSISAKKLEQAWVGGAEYVPLKEMVSNKRVESVLGAAAATHRDEIKALGREIDELRENPAADPELLADLRKQRSALVRTKLVAEREARSKDGKGAVGELMRSVIDGRYVPLEISMDDGEIVQTHFDPLRAGDELQDGASVSGAYQDKRSADQNYPDDEMARAERTRLGAALPDHHRTALDDQTKKQTDKEVLARKYPLEKANRRAELERKGDKVDEELEANPVHIGDRVSSIPIVRPKPAGPKEMEARREQRRKQSDLGQARKKVTSQPQSGDKKATSQSQSGDKKATGQSQSGGSTPPPRKPPSQGGTPPPPGGGKRPLSEGIQKAMPKGRAQKLWDGFQEFFAKLPTRAPLLFTADRELRSMGAVGRELANKFYQQTSSMVVGAKDYFGGLAFARGQWMSAWDRLAIEINGGLDKKYKKGEVSPLIKALTELQGVSEDSDPKDLSPDAKKIHDFLQSFHKRYNKRRMKTIGSLRVFYPRMYNLEAIEGDRNGFAELLHEQLNIPKTTDGKMHVSKIIDNIVASGGGYETAFELLGDTATGPGFDYRHSRGLRSPEINKALQKAGFVMEPGTDAIQSYIASATKRGEFERLFSGYEDFVDLSTDKWAKMAEAKRDSLLMQKVGDFVLRRGLDPKQLNISTSDPHAALNRLAELGYMRVHGARGEQKVEFYSTNAKLREMLSQFPTQRERERAAHIVKGYFGRIGADANPDTVKFMSNVMVYESYLVLLFSAVASIPDLVGPIIRSRNMSDAWEGLKASARALKKYTDTKERAQLLGLINQRLTTLAIKEAYGQAAASSSAQKWLDKLFILNQQERLTNFSRVMAGAVGEEFLVNNAKKAKKGDKRAQRYLSELRVTADDILSWDKGGRKTWSYESELTREEGKALQALHQFVDESIMRPNAAQRPSWANHPYAMLVWHLKSFFWAFGKVILGGMAREAQTRWKETKGEGLAKQALASTIPFAIGGMMLLPAAALGLELRELIQYGLDDEEDYPTDRMDGWAYAQELVSRSGIYGPFELALSAGRFADAPDEFTAALAGPSIEHAYQLLGQMKGSAAHYLTDAEVDKRSRVHLHTLMRATPGVNQLPWVKDLLKENLSP